MSDRPTWVNLVSGLLVLAGLLGLAGWALNAWFSWEKGTMDESVAGAEIEEEGDWIIARTEAGEVVFEGPAEEFEGRAALARRSHQAGLVKTTLLPALGLLIVGSAVWVLGPRVEPSDHP